MPCFNYPQMGQLLRYMRNLPLRNIANVLLVVGIALVAFGQSREGSVSQGTAPVPSPQGSPILTSPTPTNPISDVELLVKGFNAPPDEEPFETSPKDETPVAASTPTIQSTKPPFTPEPTPEVVERNPPATRLVIPALGIDAPVVEVPITNKTWDVSVLTYEIAHLGGSANPGEKNNMVLAGHVTLKRGVGPFLNLESLEPGDIAIVYAGEQPYTYRVVSKRYIGPTDVSIAFPTSDPILTLITCTNWDAANRRYTQRVAVIAELVEEEAP